MKDSLQRSSFQDQTVFEPKQGLSLVNEIIVIRKIKRGGKKKTETKKQTLQTHRLETLLGDFQVRVFFSNAASLEYWSSFLRSQVISVM